MQTLFSNEQIGTVFTTEQFKSVEDIAQVDVVITTNDDLDSRFPILRVNPILEAEDILKMLDYLKHNIFRNESKVSVKIFLVLFRLIL